MYIKTQLKFDLYIILNIYQFRIILYYIIIYISIYIITSSTELELYLCFSSFGGLGASQLLCMEPPYSPLRTGFPLGKPWFSLDHKISFPIISIHLNLILLFLITSYLILSFYIPSYFLYFLIISWYKSLFYIINSYY